MNTTQVKVMDKICLTNTTIEKKTKNNKGVYDAPPNSSRNPKVSCRMKQREKVKVGACPLMDNISKVGGCARAPKWDEDELTNKSSKWGQPTQPRK